MVIIWLTVQKSTSTCTIIDTKRLMYWLYMYQLVGGLKWLIYGYYMVNDG